MTSLSRHTPGPWNLRPDPDDREAWIVVDASHSSFRVCDISPRFEAKEELCNARLIEAAPDLFNAAMQAKDFLIRDLKEPGRTVFWNLIAALKKAGWTSTE